MARLAAISESEECVSLHHYLCALQLHSLLRHSRHSVLVVLCNAHTPTSNARSRPGASWLAGFITYTVYLSVSKPLNSLRLSGTGTHLPICKLALEETLNMLIRCPLPCKTLEINPPTNRQNWFFANLKAAKEFAV